MRYAVRTCSSQGHGYDGDAFWKPFAYAHRGATDSAAAATAMACGIKTYNKAIGVDVGKKPVRPVRRPFFPSGRGYLSGTARA